MDANHVRRTRTAGVVLALVAGALCLAALPAAAWTVSTARVERSGSSTVLHLSGTGAPGPLPNDVFLLEEPWRVVVDLFGAEAPVNPQGDLGGGPAGAVAGIRCSVWKNGATGTIVRYVLDCGGPVRFAVEPSDGGLQVVVNPAKPGETLGQTILETSEAVAPPPTVEDPECAPAPAQSLAGNVSVPNPVLARTADPNPAPAASTSPATIPEPALEPGNEPVVTPVAIPALAPAVPAPPARLTPTPAATPVWPDAVAKPALASIEVEAETVYTVTPDPQDTAPSLGSADAGDVKDAAAATRPMNLDVQGADIRTVLRSIAEYGGANIVADRDVDGPTTVRLVQVPWRQALDIVCQSGALVALDLDGVIRVATLKTLRDEGLDKESSERRREELVPLETRVFTINYASAKELKNSITFALSKRGSANVDERTNTLLVSDISSRLTEVEKLVSTLDTVTRQVEITARLVDVDKTVAQQLGVQWTLGNLHSNSEQVSGSVKITELPAASSGQARVGIVRGFGNLDATIQAMERDNVATLISNPKITTVNNRMAKILVGKEVPLIVLDDSGNATTELKKVGISLEVTPNINSDHRITMDLKPEVSDLSSQATVQGGVVFNTTLADTRVMVADGETAVIGGLIRTADTEFQSGIPILRSIPLLGALFRSSDTRRENRELLIFVTPRVVDVVAEKN
jgi:type IV pilus assembly protein PilQ